MLLTDRNEYIQLPHKMLTPNCIEINNNDNQKSSVHKNN